VACRALGDKARQGCFSLALSRDLKNRQKCVTNR
jgi:hypothetical protein